MRWPSILIILAAWALICLPGLGELELKGEEGRRILPARAMLQTGDWIVPFSEGRPYFRKPPLINWSIAASFSIFGGESEWAARLPSALAVLALAFTGLWAGRRIFPDKCPDAALQPSPMLVKPGSPSMPWSGPDPNPYAAPELDLRPAPGNRDKSGAISSESETLEAPETPDAPPTDGIDAASQSLMHRLGGWPLVLALALLTSIGIIEKARLAEIESLYVSLCGIGILAWLALDRAGASPWKKWLISSAFLGAATLAKLPLFAIFFYPMAVLLLWRTGRLKELIHPAHFAALFLMLAPWAGWQWLCKQRVDERYAALNTTSQSAVLGQQTAERFDWSRFSVAEWAGEKLPGTLLLFAPWAVLGLPFYLTQRRPPGAEHLPDSSGNMSDPEVLPGAVSMPDRNFGFAAWAVGWCVILPFTLLPGYLPRYALPALPQMVLGAVFLMHLAHARERIPPRWRIASIGLRLLLIPLCAAPFVMPWVIGAESVSVPMMIALIALLPVVWLCIMLTARTGEPLRALIIFVLLAGWLSLTWAAVWLPHRAARNAVKPPAEQIIASAGPDAVFAALDPGPQPFLYYLGPSCREISATTQLTRDFTHLVIPARRWDQPKEREKLARRGFTAESLRVKDREGKEFVLIPRSA